MSYGVKPYLVPAGKVISVIGSQNADELARMEQEFARDLDRWEDYYANDESDWPMSLRDALQDLIMGDFRKSRKQSGSFDGQISIWLYALELLCRHFGRLLPNQKFEGLGSVNVGHKALVAPLFACLPPRLPMLSQMLRYTDFPVVGYLSTHMAEHELFRVQQSFKRRIATPLVLFNQFISWHKEIKNNRNDILISEIAVEREVRRLGPRADQPDPLISELFTQYTSWLQAALNESRDILAFYY